MGLTPPERGDVSRLALVPAGTSWGVGVGRRAHQQVARFEDVAVDGVPLRTLLGHDGEPLQERTLLGENAPGPAVELLEALLGERPPTYDDGCVALLVCPVCEDLYCGALGVRVTPEVGRVRWRPGWHVLGDCGDVQGHEPVEPPRPGALVFERGAYESVLGGALERYRALAAAEAGARPEGPERGWRRLWRRQPTP